MSRAEKKARWRPALGAWPEAGGIRFRVWAPAAHTVDVVLVDAGAAVPLSRQADGTFTGFFPQVKPGDRYKYRLDGKEPFPDPASRFQPEGVHGPSQVVDPGAYPWSDARWRGLAREDLILYEVHVGAFSPEGTFAGTMTRLPQLVDLGVSAIELMPLADFPGRRNWGYDGVDLFAPARCYGTPDDLRRLVDAAHRLGVAVLVDVVYNHLGPDGNYLGVYSPYYFSQHTTWGHGPNFDGAHCERVREFFLENALYWVHEFHMDGLRLDATHVIVDDSPRHFLKELAGKVHATTAGRHVHVIAEDFRNWPDLVRLEAAGGWGMDAVWADDFHHQVRRCLAGDHEGYYADFSGSLEDIATTIRKGWFYCGQFSKYRQGPRGAEPGDIPPESLVYCIQNHDQTGNRALGTRLHHEVDLAAYRAATALLLCCPQMPLLFMGQEWAVSTPFLFFTDHHDELGELVRQGRREEFKHFGAFTDPHAREKIPDPQAETTFRASQLRWDERDREPHASILRYYRTLLHLRRSEPALCCRTRESYAVEAVDDRGIVLLRKAADEAVLCLVVRLRGAGPVPLEDIACLRKDQKWATVLTSEDEPFCTDPQPVQIDLTRRLPAVVFARPGAVLLRTPPVELRQAVRQ